MNSKNCQIYEQENFLILKVGITSNIFFNYLITLYHLKNLSDQKNSKIKLQI